jgi:hypothetical protein
MYIESSAFKSVKSVNLCKSVIQTTLSHEIINAFRGGVNVEFPPVGEAGKIGVGSTFILTIPSDS